MVLFPLRRQRPIILSVCSPAVASDSAVLAQAGTFFVLGLLPLSSYMTAERAISAHEGCSAHQARSSH